MANGVCGSCPHAELDHTEDGCITCRCQSTAPEPVPTYEAAIEALADEEPEAE